MTDLFYYSGQVQDQPNSATWWHALSRGTSFAPPVQGASLNLPFTLAWVIFDWDADGYDDVLAGYGTGASEEWRLLRATGEGFGAWTSVGLAVPASSAVLVTDLNGDGLHDFAYSQGGTWRFRKHAGSDSGSAHQRHRWLWQYRGGDLPAAHPPRRAFDDDRRRLP